MTRGADSALARGGRQVAGYASLSHAATTAMKVFVDSIKQWKDAAASRARVR
jgi:hypothetical protein